VSAGGVRYLHGTGRLGTTDPRRPEPETLYDLASLTKVVALTTALMLAVEEGRVALDAPVQRYVRDFVGPGKERVTVRHLLTHTSGLPAHRRLWELASDAASARAVAHATPLEAAPGTRTVYSDLGAIVLTQVVEAAYGRPFDEVVADRIFRPLDMRSTVFRPPPAWLERIAPTEVDTVWRRRLLHGEVHDENAAWLGGVSGHAGLFAPADDLLRFGEWLLRGTDPPRVSPRVRDEFLRAQHLVPGATRALGWDTPSPTASSGTRLSPRSVGHTGFTGTSLWIDLERELVVVLLSNRVHPSRNNTSWNPVRALVADRVVEALEGLTGAPARP
jgi:CubicO group peptidase (beta-lactamase class C family)